MDGIAIRNPRKRVGAVEGRRGVFLDIGPDGFAPVGPPGRQDRFGSRSTPLRGVAGIGRPDAVGIRLAA